MKTLKDFGCKSNPFDVLTQTALEYARAIVFANSRLGNDELPEGFTEFDSEHFQFYVDRMDKCVEILSSIPKEELEICRRNSLMTIDNKQMQVNDMLFTLFNEFDTEYSRSVPFLSEGMEQVLFGVDSDTYKRHEFIRGFYEQHKNEDILTSNNLHSYLDFVCNDMDYCKKYFQWSDEKCKLVEDLNNLCELSQLDAEYLLSMIKKESGNEG